MLNRRHILLLLEWYDYRIHRGVAHVAREAGWHLNCPKDPVTNDGFLRHWRGDGCIALLQCTDTLNYFRSHRIPLVDLGLGAHDLPIPRVVTDNRSIGRLAAQHFFEHGYQEVLALHPSDVPMYRERLDALRSAMTDLGGTVTVLGQTAAVDARLLQDLEDLARRRGRRLEELSLAFFAYQDHMAAEMISLCMQRQLRIPENMAVLGVDNDDLVNAGLSVSLSSIDTDQEGLGRRAAELLRSLLAGSEPLSRAVLRHPPKEVVIRQSTNGYAVRNPLVSEALHWIQNHFHTGIQAVNVAEAVGVTQQALQRAFKECYLRSPGQEIRYQRVQAAAHLLLTTDAKLSQVAQSCGFFSVDTLISSFRKVFGVTPGKYRQQMRSHSQSGARCPHVVLPPPAPESSET